MYLLFFSLHSLLAECAVKEANEAVLRELATGEQPAAFQVDFVNEGFTLHRLSGVVDGDNVTISYHTVHIAEMDVKKSLSKH